MGNMADLFASTEAGKKLVAEAKAYQATLESDRAARVAAAKAEADAKALRADQARAQAIRDAADLRELGLALADLTGTSWPKNVSRSRWQALAWGTMVPKLEMWLRHATHDEGAYRMAFEAVYGEPCRTVPRAVYGHAGLQYGPEPKE